MCCLSWLDNQHLVSWAQIPQSRYGRVLSNLCDGPVGTPAANEEQASKTVQGLVVRVWQHLLLGGLLVEPQLPLLLVTTYLKDDVSRCDAGTHENPFLLPFTSNPDKRGGCKKKKIRYIVRVNTFRHRNYDGQSSLRAKRKKTDQMYPIFQLNIELYSLCALRLSHHKLSKWS